MRLALAIALLAASPATAEPIEGGAQFTSGDVTLRVVALSPSVLRVHYARRNDVDEPSWAVEQAIRNRRVKVVPRDEGFWTGKLSVAVDPETLGVKVRRADGSLVIDAAGATLDDAGHSFSVAAAMPTGTSIAGMGDKTGGLDRAGQTFVNWNTDSYAFGPSADPLYKSIPFFIATAAGKSYGLFLDNSYRSSFDFGHRDAERIAISSDGGSADFYLIDGPSLAEVTRAYVELTGKPPMPPRWALGYQQSRYSYMSSAEVRKLVARFDAEHFPLDAVWLDIDYQDRNRPFTVNREAFPDFEKLVGDLRSAKIATIPIVDLHIAHQPNADYAPFDSGAAGDHFLRNADDSLYVAPVWPGPSVFPDFTRAETRRWWGGLFRPLVDAGVGGIWNDMNEPAIFETPTKTMPLDTVHLISGDGRAARSATHAEIHNIYGMQNSRATFDGLIALDPTKRPFVMTRATYAGGQRYAVTWTGDNSSTWEHLKLSVAQTINLGLSGFAWTGVDVGGFIGGASPELMTRWFEYAAFMPIFRAHSGKGAPRAEPWVDGPDHLAIRRRYVEERYRLLPYLGALAAQASRNGDPIVRPITYDYPDAQLACDPSMSFTVGSRLLVSGNPTPESLRPYTACLPEGGWYDYWTGQPVDRRDAVVLTPSLGTLPVFVRAGSIIPRQRATLRSVDGSKGALELHVYPGPDCSGELYDDDGITRNGPSRRQSVRCETTADGTLRLSFAKAVGTYRPQWSSLDIIVHGEGTVRRRSIALPQKAKIVEIHP